MQRKLASSRGRHPVFTTPMYERLESNIPHFLMRHSDAPALTDNQLFTGREEVLRYLEDYAEDVRHLIKFETQVIDVHLRSVDDVDSWLLKARVLGPDALIEHAYDAVVVASGHFNVPFVPDLAGLREWSRAYPGSVIHSKAYKRPESFRDKKVLVIGNSASGIDICAQIVTVCQKPILMSQRSDNRLAYAAEYRKMKGEISEFIAPSKMKRAIRFANNDIEAEIDVVVFCTGYLYSFPFLSSLQPALIESGERVCHLYKHIFYANHPSLAVIGMPFKILPFRTCEGQAAVIARIWSERLHLPSRATMEAWEEQALSSCGLERKFHEMVYPKDLDYHNSLCDWAAMSKDCHQGKQPLKWDEKDRWARQRFAAFKKAFIDQGEQRHEIRSIQQLGLDYDTWLQSQPEQGKTENGLKLDS